MATPSDTPLAENPPNPVSQVTQPTNDGNQEAKISVMKEGSPFVNSEPIREEQVQNAVKFLSHPKVRGSAVMYRRSFLERKGLTKEEIDEAFQRVPNPTPDVSAAQPVATNQDGQIKSTLNVQSQPQTQAMQPTPVGQMASTSKMGMLYGFHWSHALLAIGVLTVSGAGTIVLFKKSIIPRLKSWIRMVVFEEEEEEEGFLKGENKKPSVAEEAAAAAKSAAAAAADVAQASQSMLITKGEEKRLFEELVSMVNAQVHEMKSMRTAIQKLDAGKTMQQRIAVEERDDQRVSVTSSKQLYANGKADSDLRSVRSLSPPASVEPSVAPHPKSYMEIMSMIQRGEKPSNIREINDAPPNPNQSLSNPRVAPRPKPWEVSQSQYNSNITPTQESDNVVNYEYPDNQSNGGDVVPWWQRKNVRISEIESGNEQKFGSSNVVVSTNERPIQRSWVPPQPPPVVMVEAAAAIRQPKKPMYQQEQQLTDDQLLAHDQNLTDELQRVTKISALGGAVEGNGEGSGVYSAELQREENVSHVEA